MPPPQRGREDRRDCSRAAGIDQRTVTLEPKVLDLNRVLFELENMCKRLVGEDIDLAVIAAEHVGAVLVDPGQLEQVVLNLIVNARDAMPRGGKLTIETMNIELDGIYAQQHAGVRPGTYSMIAVTDTGAGMSKETQTRIFEPFFTTKEQGKGTGLGLSTVLGIVAQSGGHISVYSELGVGTTFKVYLPHTQRSVAQSEDGVRSETRKADETVLLVEDDDQLRNLYRTLLSRGGYHVLDARNAGEAILVHEQCSSTIHMLLTDVVMPGISGRELAERLKRARPTMRVLYMSGYTNDAILRHGLIEAEVAFLQKPVRRDALLKTVRDVLDR